MQLGFKIRMPFGSSWCLMLKEFHLSHMRLHHEVPWTTLSSKNILRIRELKATLNSGWKAFHREKVLFKRATSLKELFSAFLHLPQCLRYIIQCVDTLRSILQKKYKAKSALKRKVVEEKRSILRYDDSMVC